MDANYMSAELQAAAGDVDMKDDEVWELLQEIRQQVEDGADAAAMKNLNFLICVFEPMAEEGHSPGEASERGGKPIESVEL